MDFNNDDDDLDEIFQGISDMIIIGLDLLLLPSSINFVTIYLMRQIYAEKRQKKKRQ